jgi:hypothetical protein
MILEHVSMGNMRPITGQQQAESMRTFVCVLCACLDLASAGSLDPSSYSPQGPNQALSN